MLCKSPLDGGVCGECHSCRLNLANAHPDFFLVEPEELGKQIKIDQVRELIGHVAKTSQQGGRKIVVMSPAEKLNIHSANAFLKCLEEPSGETILILVSQNSADLLPTIRSRCQTLLFKLPSENTAVEWLQRYVTNVVEANQLIRLSQNRPLASLEIFQSNGLALRQSIADELSQLARAELSPTAVAKTWLGEDMEIILFWLICWLNDMLRWFPCRNEALLRDANMVEFYAYCDSHGSYQELFKLVNQVMTANRQLKSGTNPNKQLLLEDVLIRWQSWLGIGI